MAPPSNNQLKFATDIAAKLKIQLPPEAKKDVRVCGDFITKHKTRFYDAVGSIKSPMTSTDSNEKNIDKALPSFEIKNQKQDIPKDAFEQRVIKYWQDGLERTAFDGYGNLETELQGVCSFNFDKIKFVLEQFFCKNVSDSSSAEQAKFIRHLVMFLEPGSTKSDHSNNIVICVFPLALKFHDSKNSEVKKIPYYWAGAVDEVPLFNYKLIGEEAEIEGLMFSNKQAFEREMASVEAKLVDDASLDECLHFLDGCFNALTDEKGGCSAWIERYNESRKNIAKLRNKEVRFKLVDGSAVAGATKNIRNCFNDLSKVLKQPNAGFSLIKNIINKNKESSTAFTVSQEKHTWDKLNVYLGHMDSVGSKKEFAIRSILLNESVYLYLKKLTMAMS